MKIVSVKKIAPALLLGVLSILFAEVLAGASKLWYLNPFATALLFSVYLCQLLFFFWIAQRFQRTSLTALYFFSVIFGLYESWITKVLWAGYQNTEGPGMGLFLGVGIAEFPILVFFWHPLLAFVAPFLAFEVLSGKAIESHKKMLQRTRKKDILLTAFIILGCTFIAFNNQFDMVTSNLALLGTMAIDLLLFFAYRDFSINDIIVSKKRKPVSRSFCKMVLLVNAFFFSV